MIPALYSIDITLESLGISPDPSISSRSQPQCTAITVPYHHSRHRLLHSPSDDAPGASMLSVLELTAQGDEKSMAPDAIKAQLLNLHTEQCLLLAALGV